MSTKGLPITDGLDAPPASFGWTPAPRKAKGASSLDREVLGVAAQYAQALENAPDDVDILLALGRCFEWLGDAATAGEVFRRILLFEPANLVAAASLRRLQPQTDEVVTVDLSPETAVPPKASPLRL